MQDWMTRLDEALPTNYRQTPEWRSLTQSAAASPGADDSHRLGVLHGWLFDDVFPRLQALADDTGFGDEWRDMCTSRSLEATLDAAVSAWSEADELDVTPQSSAGETAAPGTAVRIEIATTAGEAAGAAAAALRAANNHPEAHFIAAVTSAVEALTAYTADDTQTPRATAQAAAWDAIATAAALTALARP